MKTIDKTSKKTTVKKKMPRIDVTKSVNESENIKEIKKLVHTLQVYQIELEHQNQELRITEEELGISRNKYINFFDFSPIPYFVLNSNGVITELNLCAATMVGNERNKLIGRRFDILVAQEDKIVLSEFLKMIHNSSVKISCKLNMVNKNKHTNYVQLDGLRIEDSTDTNQRYQIALIDLTEYKKLEESLRKISEELKLVKNGPQINS